MEKYKDTAYSRNYGYWNEEEQKKICDSNVSIAGVGGDGFQLGLGLVRMGVQNISIADPEVFERENSNRVPGAIVKNYGRNKAEVFSEMAREINPEINISVYKDGVTEDNVEDFMKQANLLIDESEIRYLNIGIMLARTARKLMIPNMTVMNIGFAGVATSFDPHPGGRHITLEKLMGVPDDMPIDEVKNIEVDFSRILPYMPGYGDLKAFKAVNEGAPLPSIIQGVNIAAGLGTTQAFLHLVNSSKNHRPSPTWASSFLYNDSYTNKSGIIELPRVSHHLGLAKIIGRSAIGINPTVSYGKAERESRDQK